MGEASGSTRINVVFINLNEEFLARILVRFAITEAKENRFIDLETK